MDKREAMLILQACRPDGQDTDRAAFAEALAMTERDPALKSWWEAQQTFDRQIAAKLALLPVPGNLHATIVAGRKVEQLSRGPWIPVWLAAAAVVALLAVVGISLRHQPATAVASTTPTASPSTLSYADYSSSVMDYVNGDPSLAFMTKDPAKISGWLEHQNAPMPHLVTATQNASPLGCQEIRVHGQPVSLVCYQVAGGGVVHMFVVDYRALQNPPGASPVMEKHGDWSTASWSAGGKTYLIASLDGADALKKLL